MNRLRDYYAGKVILLTGGTGLVGTVLMEAVLRRLPEIRSIYVLVRPKVRPGGSTISGEERLWQEVQSSEAFDLLRKQHGDTFSRMFREKVSVVEGDLSLDNMGLDREIYLHLQSEVQIIINCAAMVTFDAPIDEALQLNTLGPRRLLEFARGCRDPVVAHVSTCYVNAVRSGLVPEEPTDPRQTVGQLNGKRQKPYDVDDELAAIIRRVQEVRRRSFGSGRSWGLKGLVPAGWGRTGVDNGRRREEVRRRANAERTQRRMSRLGMRWARSRGWHDVYTFTKAMGEQVFIRDLGSTRGVIVRPAIIESVWRSPRPGWLNGFRMLDPLIVAYGRGRMIDFPGNARGILDIIPVDLVVNSLLAIIARADSGQGKRVYQVASGTENPLTVQEFADLVAEYFQENFLAGQSAGGGKGRPLRKLTFPSRRRFLRRLQYRYILPTRIAGILTTTASFARWGRRMKTEFKTRLSALERLRQYAALYGPYGESSCRFLTDNTRAVWEALLPEDQRDFNFDISQLDWSSYIKDVHVPGIRRYLLGMTDVVPGEKLERGALGIAVEEDREKQEQLTLTETQAPAPVEQAARIRALSEALMADLPDRNEVEQWTRLGLFNRAFGKMAWVPIGVALRKWIGFECQGLDNIPPEGPFIVASNHNSHLDTPAIYLALGDRARDLYAAAATDYFFENRWLGWLVHSVFRAIPFDRQGSMIEGLGLILGILKMGHPLVFYPEGGRSMTGETQPFKSGIGVLSLMSGTPVVPAHVRGTFQSMPKGHSFPKRHRVKVQFGPPISVEPYMARMADMGLGEVCRTFSHDVQKAVEALDGKE